MASSATSVSCVCLTGPTACGKTELALTLAAEFSAEIVSMDSAMVYRGMDVGTAKPDEATLARFPHHLIGIREPEETYSAGQFAADAARVIREIRARGRVPIVVGGTLLYLRALQDGLAELPERDESIRAGIDEEAELRGWAAMHARLATIDPQAALRINPSDRQRIQRALEVFEITGTPLSTLQARSHRALGVELQTIALMPPDRSQLAIRIEQRFDQMVGDGFLDEVRALRRRPGLTAASASMRAVGYRQLWAHLGGEYDWDQARQRAIAATRQLAKRQLTWLRSARASDSAVRRRFRRFAATKRTNKAEFGPIGSEIRAAC